MLVLGALGYRVGIRVHSYDEFIEGFLDLGRALEIYLRLSVSVRWFWCKSQVLGFVVGL